MKNKEQEIVDMKPVDELKVLLIKEINNFNKTDKIKIKKHMCIECIKKGISSNIISLVLTNTDQMPLLNDDQLLGVAWLLDDAMSKFKIGKTEKWKLSEYFYPKPINDFEKIKIKEKSEDETDCIFLDEFIYRKKVNQIIASVPLTIIAQWAKKGLLNYNFNSQREAVIKRISGDILKVPYLNQKNRDKIAKEMFNNKFEPNTIYLNIRQIDGATPQMELDPENNIFKVAPLREEGNEHETYIDVNDGFHRINAAVKAVDEAILEGKELTGELIVCFKFLDEDKAGNFIATQELRTVMSKQYIKALKNDDDITTIINDISKFGTDTSNIFANNIAKTSQEAKIYNKLTYNEVIETTLKAFKINTNNNWENKKMIKSICEKTTLFFDYLNAEIFDEEEQLKNSIFYNHKMSAIYIGLALKDVSIEDYAPEIYKILSKKGIQLEIFKKDQLVQKNIRDDIDYVLTNIESLAS